MLKVLIEISKELLDNIDEPIKDEDLLRYIIKNGIVLDGLTNGEVLMKMFPNMEVEADELLIEVRYLDSNNSNDIMQFYPDWWNRKWGEQA